MTYRNKNTKIYKAITIKYKAITPTPTNILNLTEFNKNKINLAVS
jgi:hypothetical protein